MPKPREKSCYERWADKGELNLGNPEYNSAMRRVAGDTLKRWWDCAQSAASMQSVQTTRQQVQASYRPSAADVRILNAIAYNKAVDCCLGTLADNWKRSLVLRMVLGDVDQDIVAADDRLRGLDQRSARAIIRLFLCDALGDMYFAVTREAKRLGEDVAEPSQSSARKKNIAISR